MQRILEIKKELKMKEGLENLRRALGDKVADRKDIESQIRQSTQDRGGNFRNQYMYK